MTNLSVATGGAKDQVKIANFRVKGAAAIKSGGGKDLVSVDKSTFDKTFSLDAGADDDQFFIAQGNLDAAVTFAGKVTARLGLGNDELRLGRPAADADKAVLSVAFLIDGRLGYNIYDPQAGQGAALPLLSLVGFADPNGP